MNDTDKCVLNAIISRYLSSELLMKEKSSIEGKIRAVKIGANVFIKIYQLNSLSYKTIHFSSMIAYLI